MRRKDTKSILVGVNEVPRFIIRCLLITRKLICVVAEILWKDKNTSVTCMSSKEGLQFNTTERQRARERERGKNKNNVTNGDRLSA